MKSKTILGGKLLIVVIALATLASATFAQTTPGGTVITNKASSTYSDDPLNPTKYTATSNTVTTTVSYVAGLAITPDSAAPGSVLPGGTATFTFTVTNQGNFTDNVRFLASGASAQLTGGTGTTAISAIFIDVDGNGSFNTGDIDIKTNGADVLQSVAQNGTFKVVVQVAVDPAAPGAEALLVNLGDTATGGPTFDNQVATNSANEVRTSHPTGIVPVNGDATGHNMEAKGTITNIVSNVGAVLNGPSGQPGAIGPGPSNNTDYTNQAVSPTATNTPVVFSNTLQNTGNAPDTFVITAPTVPAGSLVEISFDGGATYNPIATGGTPNTGVTSPSVASGASLPYKTRITLPATGVTPLTGIDTPLKATSVTTPTSSNTTIDRIYAGYLQMVKTATVNNTTGVGAATDPVPGAEITYVITYTNIATTPVGTGNVNLDALSVVITEDGDVAPNNWAPNTNHVTLPIDSRAGVVVTSASTGAIANGKYVDTVGTVPAGQNGTLTILRIIKP